MKLYLLSYILLLCCIANAKSDDNNELDSEPFVPSPTNIIRPLPGLRILGGSDAVQGQFPYQVSLRVRGSHSCGGSIISRRFIVTAAHCVSNGNSRLPVSFLTIRAGSTLLNSGGVIVRVSAATIHPSYRSSGFNNDIAVLRLSSLLTLNNQIRAIPLATTEVPTGAAVVTSGWGRTSNGGALPNRLQFNTLNAIDNAECRRRIGNVPTSILCLAHRSGNGVCSGDSGGPAVYNDQLIGVTNFVINQCGTTAPDGYAKISSFVNWIRQNSDL